MAKNANGLHVSVRLLATDKRCSRLNYKELPVYRSSANQHLRHVTVAGNNFPAVVYLPFYVGFILFIRDCQLVATVSIIKWVYAITIISQYQTIGHS